MRPALPPIRSDGSFWFPSPGGRQVIGNTASATHIIQSSTIYPRPIYSGWIETSNRRLEGGSAARPVHESSTLPSDNDSLLHLIFQPGVQPNDWQLFSKPAT